MDKAPAGSTGLASEAGNTSTEQRSSLLSVTSHSIRMGFSGSKGRVSVLLTVPCSKGDLQHVFGRLLPFTCLQDAVSRGDRKYFQVIVPFLLICNDKGK